MSPIAARSLSACFLITGGIPAWWLGRSIDDDTWMWGTLQVFPILSGGVFALLLKRRRAGKASAASGVAISNDDRPGHGAGEVFDEALAIGGIVLMGFLITWFVCGVVSGRLPLLPHSDPPRHELSWPEAR